MFFRFTTAGESHGKALVTIIEGIPFGVEVDIRRINSELKRRQQGYGRSARQKIEDDQVEILSGVRHGKTLGSPISLMITNKDFVHWEEAMSIEKSSTKNLRAVKRPRPGHADLAGGQKFQTRDLRNILERASARETAARVACGAIAKQFLENFEVEILSHVIQLGGIPKVPLTKTWKEISTLKENSPLHCADKKIEAQMVRLVDRARESGDTLGGIYEVVARNVIIGLGSHNSWAEKLDARIAQAFMSIPATKAVEIGMGISNAASKGSEVHDQIFFDKKRGGFIRKTNRAGGLEGGITNGEEIRVRGYMKPISTLRKALRSVDIDSKESSLAAFERSDITAVPSAGVIGESMLAIVIANSMREKFGGDSLKEMMHNFTSYRTKTESY